MARCCIEVLEVGICTVLRGGVIQALISTGNTVFCCIITIQGGITCIGRDMDMGMVLLCIVTLGLLICIVINQDLTICIVAGRDRAMG